MTTTQGQSLWQALFFILALIAIGLAVPFLGLFIFTILIIAGLWTLRQPERTPADVFAARTAIVLPTVMFILVGLLLAVSATGSSTSYSVVTWSSSADLSNFGTGGTRPDFSPEITPENTASPVDLTPTATPLG